MKLNLKKQVVKNLSRDDKKLPLDMTPQVAGGNKATIETAQGCVTDFRICDPVTF